MANLISRQILDQQSRMHLYQRDATQPNSTQLDMYWLKTQLNLTDVCSSVQVLSSRDSVGIKYRSTIDINL